MANFVRRIGLALLLIVGLAPVALAQNDAAAKPVARQNPRIALVIGNTNYADAALATTGADAALIAQTLQAAGFDVVGASDLDGASLRSALKDFLDKAAAIGPDMQAFVYFAGRGLQYEGENYIVPTDSKIVRDADAPIEAVRVSDFTRALVAAPGRARIIVLDAARANPYAREGAPLASGLAMVDPDAGELLAFNASPGAIAPDETGPYGVYGKTLAGAMREGGLPIEDALSQTRVHVNQATKGAQIPWAVSKLAEPYFIFERAAGAPPPPAVAAMAQARKKPIRSFRPEEAYAVVVERDTIEAYQDYMAAFPQSPQAKRVRAILAARREALFWRRSFLNDTPRGYWTYLRVYPQGPHADDARRRLAILSAAFEPPPAFQPVVYADLPPPPPAEIVYVNRPYWIAVADFGPPPPPPPPAYVPVFEPAWVNLPPPPPPVVYGALPALAVALPLLATARAYNDRGGRHGFAPPNAPVPVAAPAAPPALPPSVKANPPKVVTPTKPATATPAAPAPATPTNTEPAKAAAPTPATPTKPAAAEPPKQPAGETSPAKQPTPASPAPKAEPPKATAPTPTKPASVESSKPPAAESTPAKPAAPAPAAPAPATPTKTEPAKTPVPATAPKVEPEKAAAPTKPEGAEPPKPPAPAKPAAPEPASTKASEPKPLPTKLQPKATGQGQIKPAAIAPEFKPAAKPAPAAPARPAVKPSPSKPQAAPTQSSPKTAPPAEPAKVPPKAPCGDKPDQPQC